MHGLIDGVLIKKIYLKRKKKYKKWDIYNNANLVLAQFSDDDNSDKYMNSIMSFLKNIDKIPLLIGDDISEIILFR